jgi:predicted phage terminase large subunit-like protein
MTTADELKRLKVIKWRCENDLLFFTRYFFKEMRGTKFIIAEHHHTIAEALNKTVTGDILNLIINVPPRYGKTQIIAMFIAWSMALNPRARFIYLSYSKELALDTSSQVKEILESEPFQRLWPISLKDDAKSKQKWYNVQGGRMYATAAGGAITGFGAGNTTDDELDEFGGAIIIDDPLKVDDAMRPLERNHVNGRLNTTIKSRRNSRRTPIIIVMQRLHAMDMAGYALAGGMGEPFHQVKLKALRGNDDEKQSALWPYKHDVAELQNMKLADRYVFASQYQQEPTPSEGGVFQMSWFGRYRIPLAQYDQVVQSWDTAAKAKDVNDPTACTTWGVTQNAYHLLDVTVKRMEFPEIERAIVNMALKWNASTILIEDKSTGESLIPMLKQETRLPILAIMPDADKETRARAESTQVERGLVHLPEQAPWLLDYEQELTLFPNSSHFDQVDSTSQFLKWIRSKTQKAQPSIRQL